MIHSLFSVPILQINLKLNTKLIKEFCLNIKDHGKKISNKGGWQSNNFNLLDYPELKTLYFEINQYLYKFSKIFNFKKEIFLEDAWISINKKKDYNTRHVHPFSIFSGVYYVNAPVNCGDIIFYNPCNLFSYFFDNKDVINFTDYNSSVWRIPAKNNKLIIFPSWLEHGVEPNMSDENRISLSFNTKFKQ
jgi:uncharacterized protein (TIGR02466 family)